MNRLAICFALVGFVVVSCDLLNTLKVIHASPAFKQLPHPEQLLIIELISEAEVGQLNAYIEHVGLVTVLDLFDDLPEHEAHLLNHLLLQELIKENSTSTVAVGRRDLLTQIQNEASFQHLDAEHQHLVVELVQAISTNSLDDFFSKVGNTAYLELLDVLPEHEAHQLNHLVRQHMSSK